VSIYTRFGSKVEILSDMGKQKPPYFKFPATLLKIKFLDDGKIEHYWADFLKADEAWPEIEKAIKAVPKETFKDKKAMKEAFAEAE